jgi:hypothetical protein
METKHCALDANPAEKDSKLCSQCNIIRLAKASQGRILSGRGLTWGNVRKYSETNYIKAVKAAKAKR